MSDLIKIDCCPASVHNPHQLVTSIVLSKAAIVSIIPWGVPASVCEEHFLEYSGYRVAIKSHRQKFSNLENFEFFYVSADVGKTLMDWAVA